MDGTPCEPGQRDICVDGVCRVSYAPSQLAEGIIMGGDFQHQQYQVAVGSLVASYITSSQNTTWSSQMFSDHLNFALENTNLIKETFWMSQLSLSCQPGLTVL